ncbi:hypothetical protein Bhyg_12629 [Pseudolycoriella hygida]|uniref:Uncharacterized protein n=1 Tax=Pseudolycoriella hygida TaxID=35572 RepID=A0A9Q0MZX7_9DIPT|nr:hypothetical protein Bhyg_12629 [Pseudolycoriella hygida]
MLNNHYKNVSKQIKKSWDTCSRQFETLTYENRTFLFQTPSYIYDLQNVYEDIKCFAGCVIRDTGALKEGEVLDEKLYVEQIRKLRRNFTSFDVSTALDENAKQRLSNAVNRLALQQSPLNCYATGTRSRPTDASTCSLINNFPDKYRRMTCSNLMESYALAASRCSESNHSNLLKVCNRAWVVINCVLNRNMEENFDAPFYPINLDDLKDP